MGDKRQQSDENSKQKTGEKASSDEKSAEKQSIDKKSNSTHKSGSKSPDERELIGKKDSAKQAARRKTKRFDDESSESSRRERQLKHSEAEVLRSGGGTDSRGLEDISQPLMLVGGGLAAAWGLKRFGKLSSFFLMGIGGGMIYQAMRKNDMLGSGLKRRLLQTGASETAHVRSSITIDLPVEEVYDGWRSPTNFAKAMRHIESAHPVEGGGDRWHFRARIPKTDTTIEWDAEVIEDVENERIVWRSVEGSDIHNEGTVDFHPRTDDTGTGVHVDILYHPPGARAGRLLGKYLRGLSEQVLKEDVRRFKQYLETGVVATIEGQTSGRQSPRQESSRRQTSGRKTSDRPTSEEREQREQRPSSPSSGQPGPSTPSNR